MTAQCLSKCDGQCLICLGHPSVKGVKCCRSYDIEGPKRGGRVGWGARASGAICTQEVEPI